VSRHRATRPFAEELAALLEEKGLSQRGLAAEVGVSPSHLSRLLRRADYRNTPSAELMRRIALALNLPPDYFTEFRQAAVIERVLRDDAFCEASYSRLKKLDDQSKPRRRS
jgi:transcriptional regulator with XRE-family HTH domain